MSITLQLLCYHCRHKEITNIFLNTLNQQHTMKKMKNLLGIHIVIFILIITTPGCKNDSDYVQSSNEAMVESESGKEYSRIPAPPASNAPGYISKYNAMEKEDYDMDEEAGTTDISDLNDNPQSVQTDKKKIIRDGSMTIKSRNIEASKTKIDSLVRSLQGYYEQDVLENVSSNIAYDIKIRIPSANFDRLISFIQNGSDEIEYKNITARDVTEEYVDLQSRITSKEAYLKRYREILNKATNIKDILEIERNIRIIQEEIESANGRLKYLGDQVTFSTLSVKLYQPKEFVYNPPHKDNFIQRIFKALDNGWTIILDVIVGIFSLWPIILLAGAGYFFYKRRKNKG